MRVGLIDIYMSTKEPENKEGLLWLRPFLDKEGYELLYFGSEGWMPLIPDKRGMKNPWADLKCDKPFNNTTRCQD